MSEHGFLGKAALITFLGGLGIYGVGLVNGRDDMAVMVFIITTAIAFVLAWTGRRSMVGRIALGLSGVVLLIGVTNYVVFLTAMSRT